MINLFMLFVLVLCNFIYKLPSFERHGLLPRQFFVLFVF